MQDFPECTEQGMGPVYKISQPNSVVSFNDQQSSLQTPILKERFPPRQSEKHFGGSCKPKQAVEICAFTTASSCRACALVPSFRKRRVITFVTVTTL